MDEGGEEVCVGRQYPNGSKLICWTISGVCVFGMDKSKLLVKIKSK